MTIPVEVILFFLIVLGLFAYHGFKRGFMAELIWSIFIVLGAAIYNPDILGDTVVRIINAIYFVIAIAFSGGINLVLSGDFTAEAINQVMSAARAKGPFIKPENVDLALFIILLLMIFVGFLVSAKIKRRSAPFLGLIVGVFNALLLGYVFAPIVAGSAAILPKLAADNPVDAVFELLSMTFSVVLAPIQFLVNTLGTWSIVIAIILIVVLAARSARGA